MVGGGFLGPGTVSPVRGQMLMLNGRHGHLGSFVLE
jgi:hypothetical protein